jgi:hypothetical protein
MTAPVAAIVTLIMTLAAVVVALLISSSRFPPLEGHAAKEFGKNSATAYIL